MLLLHILGVIFPVFAVSTVGYLYARRQRPDMGAVNQLNMQVFLPALVFWALADKPLDLVAFRDLALGALAVVLGSGMLALPVALLFRLRLRTFVPPMMFNNSGNMGIPVAVFAFGEPVLQAAVVLFIIENLLHFSVGLYILDHRTRLTRLLKMPVILATLAGLLVGGLGLTLPTPLSNTIQLMGQVSIPLLLFSLGVRLLDIDLRDWGIGLLGAVVCPLTGVAMVLLVTPFLELSPLHWGMLLVYGALPPAVLNYMVAEQYNQEPAKVASLVMLGNLGALVAIPAALYFALPR